MNRRSVFASSTILVTLALGACTSEGVSKGTGGAASAGSGAHVASSASTGSSTTGASTAGSAAAGSTGATGGGGGAGGSSGAGATWGEPDPGVTMGPIGQFKAFRSGCGEQIWGRWIPVSDYVLGKDTIHHPGGVVDEVTYAETPSFETNQKTVFLLDNTGNYEAGTYKFDFEIQNPNQSILTYTLSAPAGGMFQWPGQFAFVSASNDVSNGLQVDVTPAISGTVERAFVYDAGSECLQASITLVTAIPISSGITTQIDVGAMGLTSGAPYLLVLQGLDAARQYDFYATLTFDAP